MSNTCIVIPARANSQRVENKNFKPFADGPSLLERTIAFAQPFGHRIVVTTDHPTWQPPAGIDWYRRARPPNFPELPMGDVLKELVPIIEEPRWLLLQPTSPLRDDKDIERAFRLWSEHVDSVFTVKSRFRHGFCPDGICYLFKRDNLPRYGHLFGRVWKTYTARLSHSLSIDTESDFTEAEDRLRAREAGHAPRNAGAVA